MYIQPTFIKIWKKQHKLTKGNNEFCDMFVSFKTGKDENKKYNNIAAVAFGDTAKSLTQFKEKDSIKVTKGRIHVDMWDDKAGKKQVKTVLTIYEYEVVEND